MCWWHCVDVLMSWWHCVDVLMSWCADVLMTVDVLMSWGADVWMCWWVDELMCGCVDEWVDLLMCWWVDVLMSWGAGVLCWWVDVLMWMCWCRCVGVDVLVIVLGLLIACLLGSPHSHLKSRYYCRTGGSPLSEILGDLSMDVRREVFKYLISHTFAKVQLFQDAPPLFKTMTISEMRIVPFTAGSILVCCLICQNCGYCWLLVSSLLRRCQQRRQAQVNIEFPTFAQTHYTVRL
jgi:hypothetical protein